MPSAIIHSAGRWCAFIILLAAGPASARAGLVHRWSFNNAAGAAPAGTSVVDSVASAQGFVRGGGATFSGTALTIPGTTNGNQTPAAISAYVDLPNGIISSKTNLTVEVWATQIAARNWQRLFDFGRTNLVNNVPAQGTGAAPGEILPTATAAPGSTSSSDDLMLAINRSTSANQQRLVGRLDGATELTADSNLTLTPGTQYHFALTFTDGVGVYGSSGGQVKWYLNGTLAATLDVNFHLSSIEDVNNWLGRSQFANDSNANVAYDEFRIHDFAMSATQVNASRTAGANATFAAPVTQPDAVTMHIGQKARVAVLANDTGDINANTVAVVTPPQFGTAVPDAGGRILYTHTTGSPAGDSFTYRVNGGGGQSDTATVTITFATGLRIANSALNVPATAPTNAWQLVAAFDTLTFNQPVCIRTPPGETQRLFVCQKGGLLRMIPSVTAASPTTSTFLDLPTLLTSRGESLESGSECGLLSVAFHPNYANNRRFFVFYSVNKGGSLYQRVSRFVAQANFNAADLTVPEVVLIEQIDQAGNHNGGDMHFGPDGYLYISVGDEGDANDTRNNSQTIDKDMLSAILRIDVDNEVIDSDPRAPRPHPNPAKSDPAVNAIPRYETSPGSGVFKAAYSIPVTNPFVHTSLGGTWNGTFNGAAVGTTYVRSEFWAVGMRNPWRITFDPQTNELWCGDVGQDAYEEVDIITRGANYGWAFREANHNGPKSAQAPANFDTLYHTQRLYEYGHGSGAFQGNSITGGIVYRGSRFPALQGLYIFADYVSGNIWTLPRSGTGIQRIAGEAGIVAFGADPSNGDVLLADIDSGRILRLVSGTVGNFPQTLSDTALFADLTDLSPNPSVLPYTPNLPFWSDHAIKSRWFTIPDGTSDMTWSRDGLWTFPSGGIWVKHFDLPLTRSDPPNPNDPITPSKRIETRVLVKNAGGAYGVSYRWNDAGTEATLVPDEGVEFDVNLTQNGQPYTQRWLIPSRSQCLQCHTPQAGHVLSFNTRQLNRSGTMNGFAGNQLDLLRIHGYFTNVPDSPNVLPRHLAPNETAFPLEARVRSYLAVNCAYCHRAGGTAGGAAWDGRPELTLTQTGLINGIAVNNGGNPANKLVVPGDTLHSIVLSRMAVANGFTRMPPIATNELDQTNIALVTDWISALLNRQTYDQWRAAQAVDPGVATDNPDSDGANNQFEFLAGTDPFSGFSFFAPQIAPLGQNISVSFNIPANRSFQIETSPDMFNWSLWDVAGNNGIAQPGGPTVITGPQLGPKQFFRLNIWEN